MIGAPAAPSAHPSDAPGAPIEPIRFDVRDLDPDADPRIDLDAFVNARWRASHPVPADRSCWDAFTILAERSLALQAEIAAAAAASDARSGSAERIVGDFWSSANASACDIEAIAPELARIEQLDSPTAIAAYLRDRHARGLGVVFRVDVAPDFANPATSIAFVAPAGIGLPDRDDYFDATSHGIARRRAYLAHVQATLEIAGSAQVAAFAEDVLALETRLAEGMASRRELARDIAQRYRPIDIDAADRATPHFRWSTFFRELGIEPPERISMAMPAFFAAMNDALATVPVAIWRAYLVHHTADDAARYVGGNLAAQHHVFHGEMLRGQRIATPRWKRVLETIDAEIGEAMGELYVARSFEPAAKGQVAALCEALRAALRTRLRRVPWMGARTREAALCKLEALRFKLGYPERWRDWSGLRTNPNSLYANVAAARCFNQQERVARIGRPVDRARWPMPPQTVNAGYDPQSNEIVFPAALLAPPFFDANADAALNLGGVGAVIAHEMIHAFDDQGSRFGADGRFENWWTAEDRTRFDALAARMSGRFDKFASGGGDRVDGRLTLGENIADFGGLAVAFDALASVTAGTRDPLIDGYTQPQRFFLSWAALWRQNLTLGEASFRIRHDTHAPAGLRANAAPSDLAAYAEAFSTGPGDPMYVEPADRVGIW